MGSEQHYSLRWNDYTVKIVTAFQSLRDEEDFVDVTVACDGHSYSAHKMVLSACSPYFRALLRANPCQHPIVILKDVGHIELERLLEFMYNGEVSIAQDQLAAFLKTAENLKIRGLAGSSDEMDHMGLQRPDVSYSYSSCAMGVGGTSGRSSPSAGYAPSQGSKEEEGGGDCSGGFHNRNESPSNKRRKRTNAPAAGQADSNSATHPSEAVVGDASVEIEGGGSVSGGMPGEENRRKKRRELKSEPGDSLADVYAESSELTDPATGEGLDSRHSVLYPLVKPRVIISNRKATKLIDEGNYVYERNRKNTNKSKQYWMCENRSCRARVHTIVNDPEHLIIRTVGQHNHKSDLAKVFIRERLQVMKTDSQKKEEPASLVSTAIKNKEKSSVAKRERPKNPKAIKFAPITNLQESSVVRRGKPTSKVVMECPLTQLPSTSELSPNIRQIDEEDEQGLVVSHGLPSLTVFKMETHDSFDDGVNVGRLGKYSCGGVEAP